MSRMCASAPCASTSLSRQKLLKRKHSAISVRDTDSLSVDSGSYSNVLKSPWKRKELERFKVFYADSKLNLQQMSEKMKKTSGQMNCPYYLDLFIELSKEFLSFNIDISELERRNRFGVGKTVEQKQAYEAVQGKLKELFKYQETALVNTLVHVKYGDDILFGVMLSCWIFRIFEFLNGTKHMIEMILSKSEQEICLSGKSNAVTPRQRSSQKKKAEISSASVNEGLFTGLFKDFTKIFFLDPQSCCTKKTSIKIRNKRIGCVPDVRYFQQSSVGEASEVLMVLIEMKSEAMRKPSSVAKGGTWISKRLNNDVLEQIGTELVLECRNSAFYPNILGLVCMKTEVIFVYLEIKRDHLEAIYDDKHDLDGKWAHINYTESYDIMKANDRAQLVEILLWLGYLQKRNFKKFFTQE